MVQIARATDHNERGAVARNYGHGGGRGFSSPAPEFAVQRRSSWYEIHTPTSCLLTLDPNALSKRGERQLDIMTRAKSADM